MFLGLNNQPKNKIYNKPNYKDYILTANKEEVRDKAKKGLLSENTSDKVDLENGTNTEEAIMKFNKASEEQRKKALEELFKNLAEQVSNVFKNHSNSSSENAQLAKDQIPATNTDGTSQTEKTQTDKTYEAVGGTTPLWSEEDKKDPIYERYNKQSDEFKSIVMSGYLKNKDKVASFKDYVSSVFKNKDALGEGIKNAGNYNKPTNPTVPPLFDAGAKIKQLETQLASMQEAYEKLQAKGVEPKELKEQIDKVQAELDKLRDSVANAPQPPELAGVDTALPANWTYGDPDKQTENPQPPVINAEDTSLLEKTQISETNTVDKLKQSITDTNNEVNNPVRSQIDDEIKQLETKLAIMQKAYEKLQNIRNTMPLGSLRSSLILDVYLKLQSKGIEPNGLKEQIDKAQAELDKLRDKNN